jgi:hypothetical protein
VIDLAPRLRRDGFPVADEAMFYGLAGRVVEAMDPYTEAGRVPVLASFLTGYAAMAGRTGYFVVGATRHYPLIWTLLVGGTSLGMKGTAWNTAVPFLATVDHGFLVGNVLRGLSSGEGLIDQVRDETVNAKGEVAKPGVTDKRLLLVLGEFRRVMAQMKRDTNTLADVLREAWDCPAVLTVPNREDNALTASAPHIGITAHVTPGEFRTKVDPAELAGGSLNRFLFIAARQSKDINDERCLPEAERDTLGAAIQASLAAARRGGQRLFRRTPEAQRLYAEAAPLLKNPTGARTEDDEGRVATVVTRGRPHVLRLALVYALLDEADVIDAPHMHAALALWRYSVDSALWLFRETPVEVDLTRLREFIDTAGPAGRGRTEISVDLFARHKSSDQLNELISQLGPDYEEWRTTGAGRPSMRYRRRTPAN